jgi:hypothetical protein
MRRDPAEWGGPGAVDIIGGGVFAFPSPGEGTSSPPRFLSGDDVLFANARSAIAHVVRALRPRQVWVPSYLCKAVLDAIPSPLVRFYEVTAELEIGNLGWLGEIQPHDVVVVIDYFGFTSERRVVQFVKERGARVLEDASQALLTAGVGEDADFAVFSPRKFIGVPDGGILKQSANDAMPPAGMEQPPAEWWWKALASVILRRDFDVGKGSRDWFLLAQEVEREAPVGEFAMSHLSRALLDAAFDYHEIERRRRENYAYLAGRLASVALFPTLPTGVVPLGFPIVLEERSRIREALFSDEIYPMVHWPIDSLVPGAFHESHRLSSQILTLPCDQRYGLAEMDRVATRVIRAMG